MRAAFKEQKVVAVDMEGPANLEVLLQTSFEEYKE